MSTTDEDREGSAGKGRVWWVLVPAGLTAAAAFAELVAVVMGFAHH